MNTPAVVCHHKTFMAVGWRVKTDTGSVCSMNIAGFKERLNENTPHACYTRTTRVYATNSLGNTPTVDIAERSNGKNDNYQSNKIGKKKNKKRHASARFASRCLSELLIGYSAGLSG